MQQRGINGECGKTHLWLEKMLKLLFFVRLHCDLNRSMVDFRMKELVIEWIYEKILEWTDVFVFYL